MSAEKSLWGTFSVADHRRPRPFIADVLLYDRLVIPIPDSADEFERWRDSRRDPDLQKRLLEVIGDDLTVKVPWSLQLHNKWAQRFAGQETSSGGADALVRNDVAQAVEFDVNNVEMARRNRPVSSEVNHTNDDPDDRPDDPGLMMTRMVLVDEMGSRKDQALVAGIPRVDEVQVVVAYGSYRRFKVNRGALAEGAAPGSQPVFTFGWPFFVPSGSNQTDEDLLRKAVELAHDDKIVDWRAAVQRWRRNSALRGQSDVEAHRDMEELIREYKEAARKRNIGIRLRWAFTVAAAAADCAAVPFPLVGVAGALFGLASFLPSPDIPKRLDAAAMFHEARRVLG